MKLSRADGSKRTAKAQTTRAAILASARKAFAEHGYEGAGLRGIAESAGVTAMMVNRYFGSKEGLFGEVVADSMRDPVILSPENLAAPDLPRTLANALVGITASDANPLDGFLILFRSTSSPVAARIARERIALAHQTTATNAVVGENAPERAALLLSLVAGVQMMRQMVQLEPLAKADPAILTSLLAPVIAEILRAPLRSNDAVLKS
jgi:AcrR family transcriptional regulator